MPYTTLPLLQDRFGESELIQLTDKATPRTGAIVVSVVDKAIADADAEIDGFVGVRYAVPLPEPTPPVLVPIACDIARYRLYGNAVPDSASPRLRAPPRSWWRGSSCMGMPPSARSGSRA